MSINALQDFMIHYHTYKNIDLVNQGLYQIRTRIFYMDKSLKYFAIPYYFTESKEAETFMQTDEQSIKPHNIISNHINENVWEYVTKTFLIRYSDEEVELDEFCYFRIEVPHSRLKSDLVFTVELELFFSDALSTVKEKKAQTASGNGNGNNILNNVEFKSVSTQVMVLSSEGSGYLESYSPIVYSDSFSSLLNLSVHKIVLDYKMRINNIQPFLIDEKKIEEIKSTAGNGVNSNNSGNSSNKVISTAIPTQKEKKGSKKMEQLEIKHVTSLIQFLLNEKDCQYRLDPNIIDELYEKYVMTLVCNYCTLKHKFNYLMSKLIEDKMKPEFPFFVLTQPLSVYSEEKDLEIISIQNEENLNGIVQKMNKLSQRITDYTSDYIASRIFIEINFIGCQIFHIWHKYIDLIRYFPVQTNFILQMEYNIKYKEEYEPILIFFSLSKFMKKSIISLADDSNLLMPIENNLAEHNNNLAKEIRAALNESYIQPVIENMNNHIKPSAFPILFEETYIRQISSIIDTKKSFYESNLLIDKDSSPLNESIDMICKSENSLGLHLIVLVHGFQGNAYDMRLIKNAIALVNPSCVFLSSTSNQDDTECDFIEMGKKLATEVKSYIKEWNDGLIFKKISFIGHSIGGLIIRAALPHLEDYMNKMWMYMSLSSPHLGYIYTSSKLVDAGMWLLKTWKRSKSLDQLCLCDAKEMKDCCVFKLSEFEGLNWFNHLYLISSHQDYYAPYESTRIQLCFKSLDDDYKANIYRAMAINILSKLTKDSIKRVDVNFVISEKNIDSFIGRTAHIQFLENIHFMKVLFTCIADNLS